MNEQLMIVGGRGCGKTHRLLEMLLDDDKGVMICASGMAAVHSRKKLSEWLQERGLTEEEARLRSERQIITPVHAAQRLQGHSPPNIYVDNLTWVLSEFLNVGQNQFRAITDNIPIETPQGKRFEILEDNPHLEF